MKKIEADLIKKLSRPKPVSHKGQNGKLMIIGGSELFHAASRWSLLVASRIVDMVFYSSVPLNNELIKEAKKEFNNGIVVPRSDVDQYISEADCILIGPGMERSSRTQKITNRLLAKFYDKRWVVDAGALQMMDADLINPRMILTPHKGEFGMVFDQKAEAIKAEAEIKDSHPTIKAIKKAIEDHPSTIVLKGPVDLACSPKECVYNTTGNEGMIKGGTGDTLAGLIAALYCTNEAPLAAQAGIYINGLAGDQLYKKVGPYFNASDLANQIPVTMKKLLS